MPALGAARVDRILDHGLAVAVAERVGIDGLAAQLGAAGRAVDNGVVMPALGAARADRVLGHGFAVAVAGRVFIHGLAADLLAALGTVDDGVVAAVGGAGGAGAVLDHGAAGRVRMHRRGDHGQRGSPALHERDVLRDGCAVVIGQPGVAHGEGAVVGGVLAVSAVALAALELHAARQVADRDVDIADGLAGVDGLACGLEVHHRGVDGLQAAAGVGRDPAGLEQDGGVARVVVQPPADKALAARITGDGEGAVGLDDIAAVGVADLHRSVTQRGETHVQDIGVAVSGEQRVIEAAVVAAVVDEGVAAHVDGGAAVLVGDQGQRNAVVTAAVIDPGALDVVACRRRDGQTAAHQTGHRIGEREGPLRGGAVRGLDCGAQALAAGRIGADGEELDQQSQHDEQAQQSFSFQFHGDHLILERMECTKADQPFWTALTLVTVPRGTRRPWTT